MTEIRQNNQEEKMLFSKSEKKFSKLNQESNNTNGQTSQNISGNSGNK